MSELNCEGLIPPFVEHLVAGAKSFDSIVPALDKRASSGGTIFHTWWEDGTKQRIAIIKELDDLRSVNPSGKAYYVVPQSVVDQVAEWDRKFQIGDEWDRQIKAREAAETLTAKHRLAVMDFSPRVLNALNRNGLEYVEDLLGMTNDQILALRNFGKASYDELRTLFINHGFADPDSEEIRFLQPVPPKFLNAFSEAYGKALLGDDDDDFLYPDVERFAIEFSSALDKKLSERHRDPQSYEVTNPPYDGN